MSKKKVALVITGTILVNEDLDDYEVDNFTDSVQALGMTITEVETYDD